jgi:hypothetical protein
MECAIAFFHSHTIRKPSIRERISKTNKRFVIIFNDQRRRAMEIKQMDPNSAMLDSRAALTSISDGDMPSHFNKEVIDMYIHNRSDIDIRVEHWRTEVRQGSDRQSHRDDSAGTIGNF